MHNRIDCGDMQAGRKEGRGNKEDIKSRQAGWYMYVDRHAVMGEKHAGHTWRASVQSERGHNCLWREDGVVCYSTAVLED